MAPARGGATPAGGGKRKDVFISPSRWVGACCKSAGVDCGVAKLGLAEAKMESRSSRPRIGVCVGAAAGGAGEPPRAPLAIDPVKLLNSPCIDSFCEDIDGPFVWCVDIEDALSGGVSLENSLSSSESPQLFTLYQVFPISTYFPKSSVPHRVAVLAPFDRAFRSCIIPTLLALPSVLLATS